MVSNTNYNNTDSDFNTTGLFSDLQNKPVKILRQKFSEYLKNQGISDVSAVTAVILCSTLNLDKTALIIGNYIPSLSQFDKLVRNFVRAAKGEPVQYITEKAEFMSLDFSVCPGILIPRSDTEVLVETCIDIIHALANQKQKTIKVLDLCCGSGCIGLSIANYCDNTDVTLCDISDTAIKVTKKNADNLSLTERIKVLRFDVLNDDFNTLTENMPNSYDVIVSNPPYIETEEIQKLDSNVKDFEPKLALDGGNDGLIFYKKIADTVNLSDGGYLAFEIGYNQGKAVFDIMTNHGYNDIKIIKDIENRDRVVIGRLFK